MENNAEDRPDGQPNTGPQSQYRNTAPKVVDKDALFYKMDHKKRGVALIFNHEHFYTKDEREGTNADRDQLKTVFGQLGFEVRIFNDLDAEDVLSTIREVSEEDHSDHDCFVMCVLSHGTEHTVFGRDRDYKSSELWEPFTADQCKTLAGKPKMFFIQACRGKALDGGITLTDSGYSYTIPVNADFLIVNSTMPGFSSWRHSIHGSWFVQALCLNLSEKGFELDLMTILTSVNQQVATDFGDHFKQMPSITSMLTRLVKFQPKRLEH